jgi:hypothetical protein
MTFAIVVVSAPHSAFATCTHQDYGNYGIAVFPDQTYEWYGVGFSTNARDDLHLDNPGLHVESVYAIVDVNYWIEIGVSFVRSDIGITSLRQFTARQFGDYTSDYRKHDWAVSTGNHRLWTEHHWSDGYWHMVFDGVDRYSWAPYFKASFTRAAAEIFSSCDDGTSHHWWLQHMKADVGDWQDWQGTHWTCDNETGYGYDPISDTEFRVSSRPYSNNRCSNLI